LRDRLVSVWTESQILRVLRLRTVSAVLAGKVPGPEASVRKAIADAHGQHVMNIARDLAGPLGMLAATGPVGGWALEGAEDGESGVSPDAGGAAGGTATVSGTESGAGTVPRDASGKPTGDRTWSRGFLYSPALTVGGGTAEVQRNIVAEKVLGLPRDP
jgi:3-oxochol-4-en-24-oyl-CoA dehydrogenase